MKEQIIEMRNSEGAEKYVKEIFEKCGIDFTAEKQNGNIVFTFYQEEEFSKKLIGGVIVNFYKLAELTKELASFPESRAYYALLGALLGLEQEEESDKIYQLLDKENVTNIDGFYLFCMPEIRENWKNLATLAKKLFSQCRDENDIYALSVFMLGMDENISKTIVVDKKQSLYWEKNGIDIEIVPFFGDSEKDIIVTLLSNKPSDVIVSDPNAVSAGLMTVIRALGE